MDQRVLIGDNTDPDECWSVMVVEVRGDKVRLGLRAPREVTIHRAEVAYCCFLEDLKTAGIASQSEEGRRRLRETFPERLRTEMAW
ncbi:carbon storage regulator [Candidatus Peregrinibacteria bacterium]|nr:carbon storage regulator [Candidatus Peregrinibacteria bacterium]